LGVTFIDLFAGIGGMRIPFDEHGFECVFSSEWDKHAALVYFKNFHEAPFGDISKIEATSVPNHDLLLAGFPCQPFSHAGLKKGFEDTRGTLFFDVARILSEHKPKVILLENVRGLLHHDKGETFKRILQVLNELGYATHWKLLNSKNFGLPQNRSRIFIVGIRSDIPNALSYSFPNGSDIKTEVKGILDPIPDPDLTISDRLWAGHQRRRAEHSLKGNGFGYSLVDGDTEFTRTLSARYYKDGSEILVRQEGANPRKLSVSEARRLQGFPDWFKTSTSRTNAYKQFGNSVSVPVIREISISLLEFLK
jgi:DNA (cytosine-5)-methyltransferase 1